MVAIKRTNEGAKFAHQIARTDEFLKQCAGVSAKRANLVRAHRLIRRLIANSPRGEAKPDCVSLPPVSCAWGFKNGIAVAQ